MQIVFYVKLLACNQSSLHRAWGAIRKV